MPRTCKLCKQSYNNKNKLGICYECGAIYQHYFKKLWNMEFVVDKVKITEWLTADFCTNCEAYGYDEERDMEGCTWGEEPITCELIRGMV
jgi:MoaA/NifB/PqqE/SkfB family radical SAM enzyme